MSENYSNLTKAIDKVAGAYLNDELDPSSAGARDLIEDLATLYKVKNEADKIKGEAKRGEVMLKSERRGQLLSCGTTLAKAAGDNFSNWNLVRASFIAESDAGRVMTTRTFRDFVSKMFRFH